VLYPDEGLLNKKMVLFLCVCINVLPLSHSPKGSGSGDKLTPSEISQTYGCNKKQFPTSQLFPTANHKINLTDRFKEIKKYHCCSTETNVQIDKIAQSTVRFDTG